MIKTRPGAFTVGQLALPTGAAALERGNMTREELNSVITAIDHCDNTTYLNLIKRLIDHQIYCIEHPGFKEEVADKLSHFGCTSFSLLLDAVETEKGSDK